MEILAERLIAGKEFLKLKKFQGFESLISPFKKDIIVQKHLGRVKKHSYPLPIAMIQIVSKPSLKFCVQWCLGYKEFTVLYFSIKYYSPIEKITTCQQN